MSARLEAITAPPQWTNLFPRNTGLPVTIWISADGAVTTDPYHPQAEHTPDIAAWVELNRDALTAYWRGDIDGWEMLLLMKRAPGVASKGPGA